MRDFAQSHDPAVQAQLDRLAALSLPTGRLGLETITALLARLGNPHRTMPPAFHVAGTNGKGSTCAFLRAMLEAQGLAVHVATSPHLVRYNERIRLAGRLIDDRHLADVLREVLDAGADLAPSFFEITIAASFLAFVRVPADVCVIEVGLGGRFDATNVLAAPLACGIAALGIDHERFLLAPEEGTPAQPLARIAFEKAGIAKPGVPLVALAHAPEAAAEILRAGERTGAPVFMRGAAWDAHGVEGRIHYRDASGVLDLPIPALAGPYQADNAALAVALLRHQNRIAITHEAMAEGLRMARWPARLQRLGVGPLSALMPGREVWLDGGHNAQAAVRLAEAMAEKAPFDLIMGLLANRDIVGFLGPLAPFIRHLVAVPVPGHDSHAPQAIQEVAISRFGLNTAGCAPDTATALRQIGLRQTPTPMLIAGSLYLAGRVLEANGELPE